MKQFHWYIKYFREYLEFERKRIPSQDKEWKKNFECACQVAKKMDEKFKAAGDEIGNFFKPSSLKLKKGCETDWPLCAPARSIPFGLKK